MWPRIGDLRTLELGDPGGNRVRLNDLVLAGSKQATCGLWQQDYVDEGEAPEAVGERLVLVDVDGSALALIEVTRAERCRFGEVTWEFVQAEGEGDTSVDGWRAGHRRFWAGLGVPVEPDTAVVLTWFRLVSDAPAPPTRARSPVPRFRDASERWIRGGGCGACACRACPAGCGPGWPPRRCAGGT